MSTVSLDISLRNGRKIKRFGNTHSDSSASDNENPENFSSPIEEMTTSTFNVSNAIKLIPEFDGDSKTISRFLQICNIQNTKATTAADKIEFLDIVKAKITGRAYNTLLSHNDYSSWEEMEKDLKKHFLKYRSAQAIQSEFFLIRQGPRESVSSYSNRIELLLEELNIASTINESADCIRAIKRLNETMAINNFKRSLKSPLKIIVNSTKHDTLSSAIDYAREEEQILETDKTNVTEIKCNYCKHSGHTINECRKRQNIHGSSNNSQNFPKFTNKVNTVQNKVSCRYCKNLGHTIEQCRKRQYNNSKRKNQHSTSTNTSNSNSKPKQIPKSGNSNTPDAHGTTFRVQDM